MNHSANIAVVDAVGYEKTLQNIHYKVETPKEKKAYQGGE